MPRPYKKGLRSTVYERNSVETCRGKIQTTQLLNRLHENALGKVQLDSNQVRSIEILLRKALPDLSAVEVTGDTLQPFAVIPQEMANSAAWEAAQKPVQAPKPDPATKH
jgi:hypothetical protein